MKYIELILLIPVFIFIGTINWWNEVHIENSWLEECFEVADFYMSSQPSNKQP